MKVAKQVASKRLDSELVALFGRSVVNQSRHIGIGAMLKDVELLKDTASRLRQLTGQPAKQRAIVESMNSDAALALCKWIREPATGRRLREQASKGITAP